MSRNKNRYLDEKVASKGAEKRVLYKTVIAINNKVLGDPPKTSALREAEFALTKYQKLPVRDSANTIV